MTSTKKEKYENSISSRELLILLSQNKYVRRYSHPGIPTQVREGNVHGGPSRAAAALWQRGAGTRRAHTHGESE